MTPYQPVSTRAWDLSWARFRGLLTDEEYARLTWCDYLDYLVYTLPAGLRLADYFDEVTQ